VEQPKITKECHHEVKNASIPKLLCFPSLAQDPLARPQLPPDPIRGLSPPHSHWTFLASHPNHDSHDHPSRSSSLPVPHPGVLTLSPALAQAATASSNRCRQSAAPPTCCLRSIPWSNFMNCWPPARFFQICWEVLLTWSVWAARCWSTPFPMGHHG
jgi:hypothetical protein